MRFLFVILSSLIFVFLPFGLVFANTQESGDSSVMVDRPPIPLSDKVTMTDPMGSDGTNFDVNDLIGRIIGIVLGFVGSIGLALFTYAGLMWMFAAGNASRVETSKNIMIWTVVGMTVIFTAYALVRTILEAVY